MHVQTAAGASWSRQVEADLLGTLAPLTRAGRAWIVSLSVVVAIAFGAYLLQLFRGLGVTGLNDYVSWGLYMANFVFFIGISYAGTLISAVLRLVQADWRRPITRMAEVITVVGVLVGASMIVIDMGRPDRLLTVFTSGRVQSPILWDVAALSTYLAGSVLYLYVAMIPDLGIMARYARERGWPRLLVRMYEIAAIGFRGTPEQHRRLDRALGVMAIVMIPVAVSAHTVVSWIFGVTLRPGWHSTIFGPYFVVGAIFSGTAGIITAMALFRKVYGLERYLRLEHFRYLSRLLLALTFLYSYFTLSEYLTIWYGGSTSDAKLIEKLMGASGFGVAFWVMVVFGLALPAVLLMMPTRRSIGPAVVASVLINAGMWLKRYLIVVPTMMVPMIPPEAAGIHVSYFPTWVEWVVSAGGLAFFLGLFTLFSRVVPIVSIWETAEMPPNDGSDQAPAATRTTQAAPAAGSAIALCLPLLLAAGLSAPVLAGQPAPSERPRGDAPAATLTVAIERKVEFGDDLIIASVAADGKPQGGVRLAFFVRRLFGLMSLGQDTTLPDGTAAVKYPAGLPGDDSGGLAIEVHVVAPAEHADARGVAIVPADVARTASSAPLPRALWSPSAPLGMVFTIGAILIAVWGTYAFVVIQLIAIRRYPGEVRTQHERTAG